MARSRKRQVALAIQLRGESLLDEHFHALGVPLAFAPVAQEELAQYFHERHGLKVMHADPSELTLSDDEVWYEGERVDIAR